MNDEPLGPIEPQRVWTCEICGHEYESKEVYALKWYDGCRCNQSEDGKKPRCGGLVLFKPVRDKDND